MVFLFFFQWYCDRRDLLVLTHSFPTRRSSDRGARPLRWRADHVRCAGIWCGSGAGGGLLCRQQGVGRGMDRFHRTRSGYGSVNPPSITVTQFPPSTARSPRSEEHTSELQSLMRISYAVFCLKKKHTTQYIKQTRK